MIRIALSRVMGDKRMNIQKVADATGLSRTTISAMYKDNVTRIDLHTLDKLCECLDCDVSEIVEYRRNSAEDA